MRKIGIWLLVGLLVGQGMGQELASADPGVGARLPVGLPSAEDGSIFTRKNARTDGSDSTTTAFKTNRSVRRTQPTSVTAASVSQHPLVDVVV